MIRVPLTHADLARLLAATRLPIHGLAEWMSPDDIDMAGEPESFVELNVGRRMLVLRHRENQCVFLSEAGLCAVHPSRPAACAAYPYAFAGSTHPRRLEVLPDAPCQLPADGDPSLFQDAPPATLLRAVSRVEEELHDYWRRVAGWNLRQRRRTFLGRRHQTAGEFFSYLDCGEPPILPPPT